MSVKKSNIKCLGCGSDLTYSATHHCLWCSSCGRTQKFEVKRVVVKSDYKTGLDEKKQEIVKLTNCSNCGAELKINEREITKKCPYCSSSFVLNKEEIIGLKPDCIVPFELDKQKAIEKYKQNVKKKLFLPNKFKKSPKLDSINGTYVSCFSFDSKTMSNYDGNLAIVENRIVNGKSQNVVKHKYIKGVKNIDFENYVVESSRLTSNKFFREIKPYKIDETTCYEFNENFLRGFEVESYDTTLDECKKISENEMKQIIQNEILSSYSYSYVEYFNLATSFQNNKYSYILLPIYFINFEHKGKNYQVYLNGQTGKLGNNLPKSKVKITFAVIFGILVALLFAYLFFIME